MKLKHTYVILSVVGAILPLSQLIPFVLAHGLDVRLFLEQLFANRISAFFAMDVFVSAGVLWVLTFAEGRRSAVRHLWAPIFGSLAVGVSLGLPLFLYLREVALERSSG